MADLRRAARGLSGVSAARAHRPATAQPPLTGRKRSGPLRQPRRTEKARFATPLQRHTRQGKVRVWRTPCPIGLKYDEKSSPHPRRTLWLLSCPLCFGVFVVRSARHRTLAPLRDPHRASARTAVSIPGRPAGNRPAEARARANSDRP